MSLLNRMFLFINCSLWVAFSLFRIFWCVVKTEVGPMRSISPLLWCACCRQKIMSKTCTVYRRFVSRSISLTHTNRLFSETVLFNQKSRTPVLRPLISFVVSLIERHAETKQLHPTRLTHGSIAQRYFWEGGQDRFPALSSSPHSTYSRWGSYEAHAVVSQWVRHRPAAIDFLEPHENHEWKC